MTEQGWYPDPQGDGERWHDGSRWTGVTRPTVESTARVVAAEKAAVRSERRIRRGHRLRFAVVLALVSVAVVGLAMLLMPGQIKPITRALGIGRPHRLLPAVTPVARSSNYVILHKDYMGDPITYDPCEAVHYVINPAGGPSNYLSFVEPAINAAQAASGLKFVYDGLSSDVASMHEHARKSAPILISFVSSIDRVTNHGEAVGLGGSTYETVNGRPQPHYLTGSVELLRSFFARESAIGALAAEQSVVMHELGHVLGLGHVPDRNEVMYPDAHGQTTYGVGDLTGLARLGAGSCA